MISYLHPVVLQESITCFIMQKISLIVSDSYIYMAITKGFAAMHVM
ncbi:hypothetical protein X975_07106, partial [Stegodyphus mimosarum]